MGRIWKGDTLIADIEELEKTDASEIYPRRVNPKEILMISQKEEEFIFPVAHGTAQLSGRDCGNKPYGVQISVSEEPQPTEPTDDAE